MIFVSLIATCVETIPELKVDTDNILHNPWFIIELLVSSWFLFELLLRFSFSPNKVLFFRGLLNWVDIIAVVPYFTVFAINYHKIRSFSFLRLVRLWRVFRLFRISNYSKRMRAVRLIMSDSLQDVHFFLLCLSMTIVFGSTSMYVLEGKSENKSFFFVSRNVVNLITISNKKSIHHDLQIQGGPIKKQANFKLPPFQKLSIYFL